MLTLTFLFFQSPLHLIGTQQPEGPCRIQYKLRAWKWSVVPSPVSRIIDYQTEKVTLKIMVVVWSSLQVLPVQSRSISLLLCFSAFEDHGSVCVVLCHSLGSLSTVNSDLDALHFGNIPALPLYVIHFPFVTCSLLIQWLSSKYYPLSSPLSLLLAAKSNYPACSVQPCQWRTCSILWGSICGDLLNGREHFLTVGKLLLPQ